jgi:hypothetical protein
MGRPTEIGCVMSPGTSTNLRRPTKRSRFWRLPVRKLSTAVTPNPSVKKRAQRCDPRNPAPPVINTWPDLVIEPNRPGHDRDIGKNLLAQIAHRVLVGRRWLPGHETPSR